MIAVPTCIYCRYCRLPESEACDAFPDGIPQAILIDGYDHRKAYPGDHGIRFQPRTDVPIPVGMQTESERTPELAKAS